MPIYNISDVLITLNSLSLAQQTLLYDLDREGDDHHNQNAYLYGNLCGASTPSDCGSWQSGLMTFGLAPAIFILETRIRTMLDSLSGSSISAAAVNTTLHSPEVQFVRDFARLYASPSLDASLLGYVQSDYLSFQALHDTRVGSLIGFLAFVLLFFFIFFHRHVHTLNAESRRIGAIFLTIPSAVLESMSKTTNLESLLGQIVSIDGK
jgi:hypothetical protein